MQKTKLGGEYYNDPKLEITIPDKADVTSAEYLAKKFNRLGAEDNVNGKQRPFYIMHPEPLTLKVETWHGKTITWMFARDGYPMPLKRIFKDAANLVTSTGEQIQVIQVGY